MIARTSYVHGRGVPRSVIFERALGGMLREAKQYLEAARQREVEARLQGLVQRPQFDLPISQPMRRKRHVPIRIRGNPWRPARRKREQERLALFDGKED